MDYPGFGLSEGLHCYIESFDGLIDDVIEHYSKVKGNHGHLSGYSRTSLTLNIFPGTFGFSDSCRCLDFMYSSRFFFFAILIYIKKLKLNWPEEMPTQSAISNI